MRCWDLLDDAFVVREGDSKLSFIIVRLFSLFKSSLKLSKKVSNSGEQIFLENLLVFGEAGLVLYVFEDCI